MTQFSTALSGSMGLPTSRGTEFSKLPSLLFIPLVTECNGSNSMSQPVRLRGSFSTPLASQLLPETAYAPSLGRVHRPPLLYLVRAFCPLFSHSTVFPQCSQGHSCRRGDQRSSRS